VGDSIVGFDPEVMARWHADEAESRGIRWDFPLAPKSLVYDVGGYTGDWTAKLIEKHECRVHIFEPVGRFQQVLLQRFRGSANVKIFPFGLLDENCTGTISVNNESSSLFLPTSCPEDVSLVDIRVLPVPSLISLNIEGSEYRVLNAMLDADWLPDHIQIQFHDFYPDAVRLRDDIRSRLTKTHREVYDYRFVWEAWSRAS
jgi:FkbM family methyltransferase